MKLVCVFALRKGEEDDPPEMLMAWDEYSIEANPEGWYKSRDEAVTACGDDLAVVRNIEIEVDEEEVKSMLRAGQVKGKVVDG